MPDVDRQPNAASPGGPGARIIGAISDAVVVWDADHEVVSWNGGAERILGIAASDAVGRRFEALFQPHALTGLGPMFGALDAGLPWDGDLLLDPPGGQIRHLAVVAYPSADAGADPFCLLLAWDVTASRLRTDAAAHLVAIVEQADDAIYTLDASSRVLTWNQGAEHLTGLMAADVIGQASPLVRPSPDERAAIRARAMAGETLRLDRAAFRGADGAEIPVSILAGPVRDPEGVVVAVSVIARDDRQRQAAEHELRFRDALLGAVRDAVVATRSDFSIGYWNQAAEELFGIPAAEALGRRLEDLVTSRFIGTTEAAFFRQLSRGETFRGDVAFTRPDGTTFTGEMTAATMPDPDGSEMGLAVIRDVTAARRTADDSAHLAAIVENAGNPIVGSSPDGVIRSWNPGAEQLLGYTAGEMMGRTLAAYVLLDHLPAALALQDRVLGGRERSATAELTYVARDGTRIPVSATLAAIRDESGAIIGVSAVAQDLRARHALELQLRQAQKLEAVGRLAGGIAADFNNLLTAVTGYGSLLDAELPPDSPARDDVRQILRATERATELTRGLLAFSRGRPRELRVVALDPLVGELLPMLRRLIPEHVEMTTSIDSGAGVRIDPTDLELVLVNLVVNAAEAMPDGGRLRISTGLVDLDPSFADTHLGVAPGRHTELVIADTGIGMTEEIQVHIFEPYFSTKAGGANPGMGLATVHANVERAGGTIWVTTTPGKGTEFRLLFPAAEVVPEPPESPAPPPGGTERVLLVEDDPLVRALATAVLRRGGYQLTVKADPRDAVGIDPDSVDLLVTDIVMPGIAGPILAARLHERRPDLPVLFMSGFAEPSDTSDLARLSSQPLLQKPFSPAGLLIAVRSALDA